MTIVGIVILGLTPTIAAGGELPRDFTLGRYVPSDVCVFINEIHNPERDFICAHWDEVLKALAKCGLDVEVKRLITANMDEDDRAAFETGWNTVWTAAKKVPWSDIGSKEFVFAERLIFPIPNYMLLSRSDAEQAGALAGSVRDLLEALASLSDQAEVTQAEQEGATVWSLNIHNTPVVVDLLHKGDVVALSFGHQGTEDILALMAGKSDKGSVVESPGFRRALASLDQSPEDFVSYFSMAVMVDQLKGWMSTAMKGAGEENEEVSTIKGIVFAVFDQMTFIDHVVAARHTDGLAEITRTVVKLHPDYRDKPLARALVDRKMFDRFDRFVPAEATGYSVSTFIDLGLIYNAVLDFIKTKVPDGPAHLAQWEALQEQFGFNPNRDIFSWLSGEIVSVSLPGVSMGASMNGMFMIRTKDAALASEKINAVLDKAAARFGESQLMIMPATEIEAEGFRSVFHPMMMMFQVKPVVGVYEDWLVIGTTPQSVNKCLAAAKGQAPTIRENKRFQKEGLTAESPVCSASFSDLSSLGTDLAMFCGMTGMWSAFIPDQEEIRPLKAMLGMVGRLGPVLAEIDFISSSSTVCTFKDDAWFARTVTTYKPPKPEPAPVEASAPAGHN